jgi:formylmethanofuran dehydrogenase subunit B
MMQNMVSASSQLQASKQKLVNHSTKKHLVQKLVDNNIPLTEIAQITGHKNVNSFNNYSTVSDKKHNTYQLYCLALPLQMKM